MAATGLNRPLLACETLVGDEIGGNRRSGTWRVVELVRPARSMDSSGAFSAGYVVQHSDGTHAYLKATDLSLLSDPQQNTLERINDATTQHRFERDILSLCHGNRLDRIVTALDFGELIKQHNSHAEIVFYLIFELATGDVRHISQANNQFDLLWRLTALHNLSVAISQLHRTDIVHNDIKPSNFLRFDEFLQKLADLGRAVRASNPGPFDDLRCVGDLRFAPPELLYRVAGSSMAAGYPFELRRAVDLYLLGSMLYFFFSGEMLTPIIICRLREPHRPLNWSGNFDGVMPYWRAAFSDVHHYLRDGLQTTSDGSLTFISQSLFVAFLQLCEPDPELRGHPREHSTRGNKYSIERYVSLFNRLRELARIGKF